MEYCSLAEAETIVEDKFNKAMLDLNLIEKGFSMPKIIWNSIGFRLAGQYTHSTNVITLNVNFLKSKSWKDFLDETPLHELAHAITWQLFDETGHKKIWKQVCYELGLKGNRCHNFEVPEDSNVTKRRRKRFSAHCDCMHHEITSVIYNRIRYEGQMYCCKHCKSRIILD